jgi:uncharacterized membrane protein YdjX (TVP38/TMEM64 family)
MPDWHDLWLVWIIFYASIASTLTGIALFWRNRGTSRKTIETPKVRTARR